jgi:uncharacterized protein YcfJ
MLYMNKSMLMGVALGIGTATAGGVAAYQFFGVPVAEQGSAIVEQEPAGDDAHALAAEQVEAAPAPARAASVPRASSAPAPRPTTAAAAPAPAPAPAAAAATLPDCNPDAAPPKDSKRIAGTALGALVGGAVAHDVGDRDITTAVGAAVGAYAGRKIQQKIQEHKASEAGTPCAQ